jgi:hypothetical protein
MLSATLFHYQKATVQEMLAIEKTRGAGLLGDEMGLGKSRKLVQPHSEVYSRMYCIGC